MEVVSVQSIPDCFNVAIIVVRRHSDITQKFLDGAIQRLTELGFHDAQITEIWIPSINEIPLVAQRIARTEKFEVIICHGIIIAKDLDGNLSEQLRLGCQQVALENDIPVIYRVMTTESIGHINSSFGDNFSLAGRKAADSAFEVNSVLRQI